MKNSCWNWRHLKAGLAAEGAPAPRVLEVAAPTHARVPALLRHLRWTPRHLGSVRPRQSHSAHFLPVDSPHLEAAAEAPTDTADGLILAEGVNRVPTQLLPTAMAP